MSNWKNRVIATAAVAAAIGGIGVGVSFAAEPLSSATTDENSATGTGIGVRGVATVNEAHAQRGGEDAPSASQSLLTVADESVLGKDSDGAWFGLLAALGPVVDSLNGVLCNNNAGYAVPAGDTNVLACAFVMPGFVASDEDSASVAADAASALILVNDGTTSEMVGLQIAPVTVRTSEDCSTAAATVLALYLPGMPATDLGTTELSQTGCAPAA